MVCTVLSSETILFFSKNLISLLYTSFSRSLLKTEMRKIKGYLRKEDCDPFLNTTTMLPILKSLGKTPVEEEALKAISKGLDNKLSAFLLNQLEC